tara:strand:+ start:363 stop:557 length:195 start_codon:yes stop_codon:yes gene_type:complete
MLNDDISTLHNRITTLEKIVHELHDNNVKINHKIIKLSVDVAAARAAALIVSSILIAFAIILIL